MNKIPVGQTVAKAYRFAFGDFPAVLGVVWLPVAVAAVAAYFLFRNVELPPFDDSDPQARVRSIVGLLTVVMGPLRIWELVLWVCTIVIEVGLTRAALGIGPKPYVFFTLGSPFWRMLGANLIFAVILMIVMVPVIGAVTLIAGVAPLASGALAQGAIGQINQGWIAVPLLLLFLTALCGFYYLYARLWFFIAPVVVAEEHIDIRRCWRLAKGNVLRIVGILFAIALPGLLVLGFAEGMTLWTIIANVPFGGYPDARLFSDHWPVFDAVIVIALMTWLFLVALLHGARAFAYRALVPAGETSPTA